MYIVLTYDVNKKRNKRILAICKKYLKTSLKSVFEGEITESKLMCLKKEISSSIVPKEDSVCIYKYKHITMVDKEEIGVVVDNSNIF